MGSNEVVCPVSTCDYTNSPASVAAHISGKRDQQHDWDVLEFEGANHYERVQKSEDDKRGFVLLGWLTDSHIGKTTGGYGTKSWPLNPKEDLANAGSVEILRG